LRILLCACVLAALAFAGWWWWTLRAFDSRVDRAMRAARTTEPPPPPGDNAEVALGEAAAWLKGVCASPTPLDEIRFGDAAPDRDQLERIRIYLHTIERYFTMLRAAADRPAWRVTAPDSYAAANAQHIAWLTEAAELLEDRVRFDQVPEGRTARAADTVALLLALAARYEPRFIMEYRVQQFLRRHAMRLLAHAHARSGFSASGFRESVDPMVRRAIPAVGPPRWVLVSEHAYCLELADLVVRGRAPPEVPSPRGLRGRWWGRPLLHMDASSASNLMERCIADCDGTPEEAAQLSSTIPIDGPGWLLNGKHLRGYFADYADAVAALRLLRVAMALLAHGEAHGGFPESLAEIAGQFPEGMPADPYSGRSFQYRWSERRVWSVRPGLGTSELHERGLTWSVTRRGD
jgi:hypothetical protein